SRPVAALILDRVSGNLRSACLMSLIARIVRVRYVWLTPHKALVAGVTVGVAVFVCLTEVALKHLAVSETRTIVLRCFLVGTLALVAVVVAFPAIFPALFNAFAETGVQSGLTQVERASEVAVTILVAVDAILVTVVVAILTMS